MKSKNLDISLYEMREDLIALCEDNEVMKETIRDYFSKWIGEEDEK